MALDETIETFRPDEALPIVTWNIPYDEACAKHISRTLQCSQPFLIVSRSMSSTTNVVDKISRALPRIHLAGIHTGVKPHTWYSEVLKLSKEIKRSRADSVITIGGGSIVDGAKAAVFAIANNVDTIQKMDDSFRMSHNNLARADGKRSPGSLSAELGLKPSTMPIVTVSTTLSGGEYNHVGGATNDLTKLKQLFIDPVFSGPRVIILDPALTRGVPRKVWLSTGMRAIDHCVESFCAIEVTREASDAALAGLKLLIPALLRTVKDPEDLEARLAAQRGACMSMKGLCAYRTSLGNSPFISRVRLNQKSYDFRSLLTLLGASHGIGHQLGPFGVPHAETSCILLPAVLKYNYPANHERQDKLLSILSEDRLVSDILRKHSLAQGPCDLGDLFDAIICELGLPRSLKGYHMGNDQLHLIARNSLEDTMCRTKPIRTTTEEQVMAILENCL